MDFLPARNEGVRWNGAVWRVEELDENKATLCHSLTGERQALTVAEWFDGVRSGLIERRVRPLPVGSDRPRKHAYMHFNDATWQVAVIRNGIINLRNVETDESGGVSVAKWKSGCLDGSVRMLASPTQQVSGRVTALLKVPVTSLPEGMQEAGKQIAVYVEAWRDPRGFYDKHLPDLPQEQRHLPRTLSKKKLVPFFDVVASVTGMPRPGFSTFCNWLRKVDDAGGDIRGALPRHDLQGPNERHMGATVETMLNQAIDEAWLTQRRNKKKKVWDTLQQRVAKWNEAHPGRPLACPSQGHVARYIRDEVDRYVVARRRGTKEEADSEFKQVGPGVKTTCILERVEVDHSLAKIKVKDDRTGVVLGYARTLAPFQDLGDGQIVAFLYRAGLFLLGSRDQPFSFRTPEDLYPKAHLALARGLSVAENWPGSFYGFLDAIGQRYQGMSASQQLTRSTGLMERWLQGIRDGGGNAIRDACRAYRERVEAAP